MRLCSGYSKNQLSRHNLNDFQRVEMVRKCEDAVKAQAEKRMLAGKSDPMEKFPQGIGAEKNKKVLALAVVGKLPPPKESRVILSVIWLACQG